MNLTDMKLPQIGSEKLEGAFVGFLNHFKQIYIGEQVNKSLNVSLFLLYLITYCIYFIYLSLKYS